LNAELSIADLGAPSLNTQCHRLAIEAELQLYCEPRSKIAFTSSCSMLSTAY
jgi:hypothetical protein